MYREVQQWQNAMEYPVYILAGFLFPILLLPGWTTPLSYLLPPYWAAVAFHDTSTGNAYHRTDPVRLGHDAAIQHHRSVHRQPAFKFMLFKARVDASLDVNRNMDGVCKP